ncbi:duodenase-1-like isoform X2 [Anabas testudineus]|uniref:duodenase-1-like isoform X2 n=1 Tax=Anabas testudineus TaxID=64144 RepID=UPI000E455430|nr:duodenase-1-like isoform X2 [Anabas testudineus]
MKALYKLLFLLVLTCHGQNGHGSEIINGEKVSENSMLYMVSVQNDYGHVCGGFLISEDFVVTAAHCDKENPTSVVLGTHNLKEAGKTAIKQTYKPEAYQQFSKGDDIMLLECLVAGWGKTHDGALSIEDELRMVDVSVIDKEFCKTKWKDLPPNVICAGGNGTKKGVCQGDSGGPLVCNETAVGVVSFSQKQCNYAEAPNVYTDVSKYLDWINNVTKRQKHYDILRCALTVIFTGRPRLGRISNSAELVHL